MEDRKEERDSGWALSYWALGLHGTACTERVLLCCCSKGSTLQCARSGSLTPEHCCMINRVAGGLWASSSNRCNMPNEPPSTLLIALLLVRGVCALESQVCKTVAGSPVPRASKPSVPSPHLLPAQHKSLGCCCWVRPRPSSLHPHPLRPLLPCRCRSLRLARCCWLLLLRARCPLACRPASASWSSSPLPACLGTP